MTKTFETCYGEVNAKDCMIDNRFILVEGIAITFADNDELICEVMDASVETLNCKTIESLIETYGNI